MSKKRRKPGRPARETGALPSVFRHSGNADTDLQLIPHSMLAKILAGEGNEECWHTIVFRLNCANAIANKSFAHQPEVQDEMEKALAAICEVGKRFKRTGKFGCTGDEFKVIGAGLNLADDLQVQTTRREQRDAYRWVYGQVGGNTEMLNVMQRGA
ncbi:hypothetical protein HTY52_28935 [Cupriavidus taiwanensis]|uniref:hypothetical protein n=1 Tax=Cupriavidus taiwanensis TaxID=164546 RepID=UPI001571CD19|nr:hypothetical protein [Cupriavidus taiwanensis]NSX18133.1 hypothetical protein [Cupriavidus taiwanensis]